LHGARPRNLLSFLQPSPASFHLNKKKQCAAWIATGESCSKWGSCPWNNSILDN
jgi:hypothetical protein